MPSKHAHRPVAVAPNPIINRDAKKEGEDETLYTLSSPLPQEPGELPASLPLAQEQEHEQEQEQEQGQGHPLPLSLLPEVVTGIIKGSYAVRTITRILINGRDARSQGHAFPKHDYLMTQILGVYNRREQEPFLELLTQYLTLIPRFVPHCGTETANVALLPEITTLMETYGFVPVASKLLGNLYATS